MKKQILVFLFILMNLNCSFSQITLQHLYTSNPPFTYTKLALSGLKYVGFHWNGSLQTYTYFKLYNIDHTLFKTINIPQWTGKIVVNVSYISETLFDTDSLVEFLVDYGNTGVSGIRVCNENGAILLELDSASSPEPYLLDQRFEAQTIFANGFDTKLMIMRNFYSGPTHVEIYNLPGQLPCFECDNGVLTGLAQPQNGISAERFSLAFPNPFKDYIKIRYSLPANVNHAFIILFDSQGKIVKKKEIGDHSVETTITNDEMQQGAYIYQIIADDKIICSDRIVKL